MEVSALHAHGQRAGKTEDRRARSAPVRPEAPRTVTGLLALQRTAGNAAMARVLAAQRTTDIGHDDGHGQDHGHDHGHGNDQSLPVQRSTVHEVLRSPGRPLDTGMRTDLQARLGADFSTVRVHDDSAAASSAAELGAAAYTSGEHVVLGRGGGDRHTMAHELTHVIQQRSGSVAGTDHGHGLRVSDPSDSFERAAEANAVRALRDPVPTGAVEGAQQQAAPAGHDHIQRSPASWSRSAEVKTAEQLKGSRFTRNSRWTPLVEAVQRYADLDEHGLEERHAVLEQIGTAMEAWRQNQRSSTVVDRSASKTKEDAIEALKVLMTGERREIGKQQQASMARTAPIGIAGAGRGAGAAGSARESLSPSDHGSSVSPTPGTPDFLTAAAEQSMRVAEPLPPGIDVVLHLTGKANLSAVHKTGLRPSRGGKGIGLPEEQGGGTDRDAFYVLSGSNQKTNQYVSQEAGERAVGVVHAGATFSRDVNYPAGGAKRHVGEAPPARQAGPSAGRGPFSFALPLRQGRTLDQLTAFINEHAMTELTSGQVLSRIHGHLLKRYGAVVRDHLA